MLSVFWIKTSLDRHDHAHTLWGFNANWQLIVSELRAIFTVPDPPMALCHLTWADTHGGKPPSSGLSVAETEKRTGVLSSRGHDSRRAVGFLCVSGEGSPGARGAGVVRPDAPPGNGARSPTGATRFSAAVVASVRDSAGDGGPARARTHLQRGKTSSAW